MAERHLVARASEIGPRGLKLVEAGGHLICLARGEDGNLYAVDDNCTHEDWSLAEGEVYGNSVECMKHGSRFDLRTGAPDQMPAVEPVATYDLAVEGDDVYVVV